MMTIKQAKQFYSDYLANSQGFAYYRKNMRTVTTYRLEKLFPGEEIRERNVVSSERWVPLRKEFRIPNGSIHVYDYCIAVYFFFNTEEESEAFLDKIENFFHIKPYESRYEALNREYDILIPNKPVDEMTIREHAFHLVGPLQREYRLRLGVYNRGIIS